MMGTREIEREAETAAATAVAVEQKATVNPCRTSNSIELEKPNRIIPFRLPIPEANIYTHTHTNSVESTNRNTSNRIEKLKCIIFGRPAPPLCFNTILYVLNLVVFIFHSDGFFSGKVFRSRGSNFIVEMWKSFCRCRRLHRSIIKIGR